MSEGPFPFFREPVSLRDQFAMAALTGLLASEPVPGDGWANPEYAGWVGKSAYLFADAMMAVREGKL